MRYFTPFNRWWLAGLVLTLFGTALLAREHSVVAGLFAANMYGIVSLAVRAEERPNPMRITDERTPTDGN